MVPLGPLRNLESTHHLARHLRHREAQSQGTIFFPLGGHPPSQDLWVELALGLTASAVYPIIAQGALGLKSVCLKLGTLPGLPVFVCFRDRVRGHSSALPSELTHQPGLC